MHSFLRAIGFSQMESEYEVELLLDDLFSTYDQRTAVKFDNSNRAFVEMTKSFGPEIGIKLCGEFDEQGFHRQYYFPYLKGTGITTSEDLVIEKRSSGDSYVGVCDDGRIEISLIFYLQNPADYQKECLLKHLKGSRITTTLSGLSLNGTILLPIISDEKQQNERKDYFSNRTSLVSAAKNGNQDAIENLTLEDMDMYTMLSRRIQNEDVFSIVDTFFMPYGMECDLYQIMGTINYYTRAKNSVTKEQFYQLNVECNGMTFDICINQKDLMGEPEEGRRFKGTVWLQGKINFPE